MKSELRDIEGNLAHAGEHGFGFEAVGVAHTLGAALVREGLHILGSLKLGGLIDHDAQRLCRTAQAVV